MTTARSHSHQPVKVRVEAVARTARAPLPPVSAVPVIKHQTPTAKHQRLPFFHISKPKLPSIERWPIQHRRRLMWGVVTMAMIVIVSGWAFFLGAELRQPFGGRDLLKEVASVFKTFKLPAQETSPVEQEIRALDKQVFPQFQSR